MENDANRRAFLRQPVPHEYAMVRPMIEQLSTWLNDPANLTNADKVASKRKLIGLEDPEAWSSVESLTETVTRAIEAAMADPANAAAYFMLARAMTELARFDDVTYHPKPLREALEFADRALELAPRVGKAWRAVVEIKIHLKRFDMVAEMLGDLSRGGFAPGTHATLNAKLAEAQGHFPQAVEWYEKSMGFIGEPHRRAEAFAAQAACLIKMGNKSEAERPFLMALLEGGPNAWIAHNWSVLKYELSNLADATELNRRALHWEEELPAALDFKNWLMDVHAKNGDPYPGPSAIYQETVRKIALPGCDPYVVQQLGAQEWQPPRRGTRARATRTFRTGLE